MTLPSCKNCNVGASPTQKILLCVQCRQVGYCSKDCQRQDWGHHKHICSKKYTAIISSTRPVNPAIDGYGVKSTHGPFHMGPMQKFLVKNNLSTNRDYAHDVVLKNIGLTPNMVFDITTGGFGGTIQETDHNGRFIGEGWNSTSMSYNTVLQSIHTHRALNVHAWCVDSYGNVYDYDDNMSSLSNFFHTTRVIRVEADEITTMALLPLLEDLFKTWMSTSGKTIEQHVRDIKTNTFQMRCCWHRAMILKASNPSVYKVRIGSYGFVQDDGINTFYVWG